MALTTKDIDHLLKHFVTKAEFNSRIDELEEKIKHVPTKEEFYSSMDKLMKELETIRQEIALTPSHSDLADLQEKIEILEKQIASS